MRRLTLVAISSMIVSISAHLLRFYSIYTSLVIYCICGRCLKWRVLFSFDGYYSRLLNTRSTKKCNGVHTTVSKVLPSMCLLFCR